MTLTIVRSAWVCASFALVSSTTACGSDEELARKTGESPAPAPQPGAADGWLFGEVGPVGVDHNATALSAFDDGHYLSVETVVDLPEHSIMTLLTTSDDGASLLQPGLSATFPRDYVDGEGFRLLGCVGAATGVYDVYDLLADEVLLTVESPSDGELFVNAEGHWFDRDANGELVGTQRNATSRFTLVR